mmetsp:Transcript_25856/g.64582  ORF Transcript_25856/g.64582 Transcript_25856/m.64582 type:complete len:217 (+) Transcript_25856:1118-1768(+)
MPFVGSSSSCKGTPDFVVSCCEPHRLTSRGTASETTRVGNTEASCTESWLARNATASRTISSFRASSSPAPSRATRSFSSASSFASYSASAFPTTVTLCGFSTKRLATSFCQNRSSASIAACSFAAICGVRSDRSPSPPCTHVPMAPKATPRPKLVETRAAPSSTWCITASTRSRGKPSSAIRPSVSAIRFSTSSTSASATPLSPTANEVSRREEL